MDTNMSSNTYKLPINMFSAIEWQSRLLPSSILDHSVLLAIVFILSTYLLLTILYNIFLHPLSKFPGPLSARASNIPYCLSSLSGRQPYNMLTLHDKYGPVVRVAPNELSFNTSESFRDIYGIGTATGLPKSDFYDKFVMGKGMTSVVSERNPVIHKDMRAQIAPAFSDRALKEQEPLIAGVIDSFIDKIGQLNGPVDLVKWFNLVTMEVMGELSFGIPFKGIEKGEPHPWASNVQKSVEAGFVIVVFSKSPMFGLLLVMRHIVWVVDLVKGMIENTRITSQIVDERLQRGNDRNDFISAILKESAITRRVMSTAQMKVHTPDIIFAGSETTATTLAACIWYLRNDSSVYHNLRDEVRQAFSSYDEIDNASASRLKLVQAVCSEALRMYAPLPFGLPRECPDGGAMVSGFFVPQGTIVSTNSFAASMSEKNFSRPWEFRPERWLKGESSGNDLSASKPFSTGSRTCLGRSLGWLEMRTLLTKLMYRYDIELIDGQCSKDWHADSEMYLFWKKPDLMVQLKPVG